MHEQITELQKEIEDLIQKVDNQKALEDFRVQFLGRKGKIPRLLKGLGKVPTEARPEMGQKINTLKQATWEKFEKLKSEFEKKGEGDNLEFDFSLPGRHPGCGRWHLISSTIKDIEDFFIALGYFMADGPEVESDFYNFEALNFPKDHPSRDMQDTFFLPAGYVLRTHTSGVQIRTMEKIKPPIKMIASGRVFRKDHDVTHSPVFYQVEGLAVAEKVSFSDLRGTLFAYLKWQFGDEVGIRFRPSFFPFTEPSGEVDISCIFCKGNGCRICAESGWLEILGCGMVDPEVFRHCNIDPEKYSGFAFGLGVERIAMLKHGISDIRLFYENDLRFLRQF
ncbi:phenylalanine--tRNA ligase subunit alpha [Candidatus Riflebacteria bacterium]